MRNYDIHGGKFESRREMGAFGNKMHKGMSLGRGAELFAAI